VPDAELREYAEGLTHLHCLRVVNPVVFKAPVKLGPKKGAVMMRRLDAAELALVRAAETATEEERAAVLDALRKKESSSSKLPKKREPAPAAPRAKGRARRPAAAASKRVSKGGKRKSK
jgi:hypothetical protein